MKKQFYFLSTILALLIAVNVQAQNIVEITKNNSGQTISLNNTQVLEIKLYCNPSTGYGWYAADLGKGVITEIGKRNFIPDSPNSRGNGRINVGQSGLQVIRFVGVSQGTTELTLEYKRPWEKDKTASDNFKITVVSDGKYTGNYIPVESSPVVNKQTSSATRSLPSSFSWQSQCTPIKNQNQCGGCWAFAACGTFEANIKIRDGATRDLAEQWLINCASDSAGDFLGCNGGWCPHRFWQSPGAVYETEEPWISGSGTPVQGTCQPSYVYHEKIDNYRDVDTTSVTPSDSAIKQAIYNYGPVWICVCADGNSFSAYTGGIYTTNDGTTLDHAVVLVGWVDTLLSNGSKGYWILRNSWGSSWGENGYMRIAYGVDSVGDYADYLVYKGGTPHNIPPVANFAASSTSSCTGTIQFADSSINSPTSWHWYFGDGTTSILQNPLHTYTANGTYTVNFVSTNGFGSDSTTKTNYIMVNLPTAPTTTGASGNGPISVTLKASGIGTLNWYDALTGGTLVDTGTTYITPILNTTTTYYVQSEIVQTPQPVGMLAKTTNGGYYTSTALWALTFDALSSVNIDSVVVYANSTANRTILLINSNGTIIDSTVVNVASGQHTIPLNFDVMAGTGYQLGIRGGSSCNLWRDKSGAVYPYTISGLISITGNTASASGYYYYFYNWKVRPEVCLSPMTPVTATIATGIKENSETGIDVFPNPNSGIFEIKLNNQYYQEATVSLMNIIGEVLVEKKINNKVNVQFDASSFPSGIYYIKLQTENGTYIKKVCLK